MDLKRAGLPTFDIKLRNNHLRVTLKKLFIYILDIFKYILRIFIRYKAQNLEHYLIENSEKNLVNETDVTSKTNPANDILFP